MMQSPLEKKMEFYIPVVREGVRFVDASRRVSISDEPTPATELDAFIERHHTRITADVELEGRVYSTTVFAANDEEELSYVLTDENLIPVGFEDNLIEVNYDDLTSYYDCLSEQLSESESLTPDQVVDLRSEFIEPEFITAGLSAAQEIHSLSWERFSRLGRLVLLGSAGSGKTSCFRKILLQLIDSANTSSELESIPVFFQMRLFGEQPLSVDSILRVLVNQEGESLAHNFKDLSHAGRFLFMFDGLDEVPERHRAKITKNIHDLLKAFPRNRVMISSRKSVYKGEFPELFHLELKPFSDSKIAEWSCQRLYESKNKSWKVFFSRLKDNQDCLTLTRNPLLLSLAVSQFSRHSITPYNKSDLFEDFISTLIERWDSARGVNRSDESWSAPQQKLYYLSKLSYDLASAGKMTFSGYEYSQWLKNTQEDVPYYKILTALGEHTGLINNMRDDEWTFSHRSLMEYLTAYYLVKATDDIKPILVGHLSESIWQEIWVLACGITPDASHLLELLCESRDPSALVKARMVCDAVSQDIRTNRSILERCFTIVANTLDAWVGEWELASDKIEGLVNNEVKSRWSLGLYKKTNERFLNSAEGFQLINLLHSVYKLRSSPACRSFVGLLRGSEVPGVRQFATVFDHEGELIHRKLETDNREVLLLYLVNG